MREITLCKLDSNGKLYGEVREDGMHYTVEAFEYSGSNLEQALLERLDILLVEAQFEAEMEVTNEQ